MDIYAFSFFIGEVLDFFGVIVIFVGVCLATATFLKDYFERNSEKIYKRYRENVGKGILIGLEVIVAGDIIRSIVGQPSFTAVGILGAIVLIRTFLSVTFDMEISGHWPWKKRE